MPRLAASVAIRATDPIRTRAARPRAIPGLHRPRRLSSTPERLNAANFNLGPLFVHSHEAVIVANVDTARVVLWNPAAERIFGWSAAEAIGEAVAVLISPAIVPLHKAGLALQRRAEEDGAADGGRPYELTANHRNGTPRRLSLSLVALERPAGASRYVLIVLREVPEASLAESPTPGLEADLDRAEQSLAEHQQAVEAGVAEIEREVHRLDASVRRLSARARAQEVRGAFLAAAHPESGTASGGSSGGLDLRGALDRRSCVAELRLERLELTVRRLATRSALAAGALQLNRERVNLVPIVLQCVAKLRARGTQFRLNTGVPQGLTAAVDPERFQQVLDALLHHATTRCRGGCWIDVDLRRPLTGQARLEVRDFGRAVSDEDRQRLLSGGHGDPDLDLARAIVDLHGGRLQFEFPADGGVRAVVTLPTQRGRILA